MPIDELKIDRSFVMNLPGDSASVAIVESVLAMSKGMNMTVVAEGVETIEQADFLASRGCHELQGYLFSKPLAKEDLLDWCCGKDYCDEHRA
jgi:EAL domain-containing protein (putative c-di-GMP-specific phosphodiesterase class I)